MIDDLLGSVDYDEKGQGPTIVFVPGSCSTGAAWKSVITALGDKYRTVTTSLPGYGGSSERRIGSDHSTALVAAAIETVVQHAECPVHLVGHSFGGEVSLVVALRNRVQLESLTILEAPAPAMLSTYSRTEQFNEFRAMTDAYIQDFKSGNPEAIAMMIDFYGGSGTFASWPLAVRAYAAKTTPTNILDWSSAYSFRPSIDAFAELQIPVLVAVGENSHPAVVEANSLIATAIPNASFATIEGAAHFMTASHPGAVAALIVEHIAKTKHTEF